MAENVATPSELMDVPLALLFWLAVAGGADRL
jgi:hypothetical protein